MKTISIIIIAFGFFSFMKIQPADFDKVKFEQNLNHQLFKTLDSILNPLTIKTEFGYDGIPDSNLYELKSTVLVNNDTLRQMRFASAEKINEETIELTIFETSPLYHQELTVQIVKDEFKMNFVYNMSGRPIERKIKTQSQKLTLKSNKFKKGEIIFGKLSFKGICIEGCSENEIKIEGYFKTEIK